MASEKFKSLNKRAKAAAFASMTKKKKIYKKNKKGRRTKGATVQAARKKKKELKKKFKAGQTRAANNPKRINQVKNTKANAKKRLAKKRTKSKPKTEIRFKGNRAYAFDRRQGRSFPIKMAKAAAMLKSGEAKRVKEFMKVYRG